MKRSPRSLLSLLIASSLSLSACSSAINTIAQAPSVQVHKVELKNVSFTGGDALFVLDVHNPNAFAIPLRGFNYGLQLNGIEVATGAKRAEVTIGAQQSRKLAVPIFLNFTKMVEVMPYVLRSRAVTYRLGGSLHFPWVNIPFQRSGNAGF